MKKTTIISLLLVACMATMCFVGGTFAKYTSTIAGTDSARVALWAFKTEDVVANSSNKFTFDLFATAIGDTKTETPSEDADDQDVKNTENNVAIIAPGTKGSFEINVKNDSEVTAQYKIAFAAVSTDTIPLQYSLNGTTWEDDIADLDTTFAEVAIGDSAAVTVYWQWDFEGDDTALGLLGTDTVEVTATVTVEQVD